MFFSSFRFVMCGGGPLWDPYECQAEFDDFTKITEATVLCFCNVDKKYAK